MRKRGQGVQFNWIFIVIVGVILLLFFLGFLVKYIDLQDSKQNAQISFDFKNHILGIKSTEQYSNFSVPKFKVNYDCNEVTVNDDQTFKMPFSIFTESFHSADILFWVEDYHKGFLVDRVVFITDANKKYYFDDVYRSNIPPHIDLVNSPSSADVVVSSNPNFVSDDPDKKEIFIDILNSNIIFVDDGEEFFYDDEFFIYAAAFSNSVTFECTKENLDERSNLLSSLYMSKLSYVSSFEGSTCSPHYTNLKNALIARDADQIKSLNNNLVNYNCEVIF